MKKLENQIPAKEFRETINKNFDEVMSYIEKINEMNKTLIIEIDDLKDEVRKLQTNINEDYFNITETIKHIKKNVFQVKEDFYKYTNDPKGLKRIWNNLFQKGT